MLRINSPEAVEGARERYGSDQTEKLFEELVLWHEMANEVLQIDDPADTPTIVFGDNTSIWGYFYEGTGITVVLPKIVNDRTYHKLPHVVFHENAHHKRCRAGRRLKWEPDGSLFDAIIDEGTSMLTETEIFNDLGSNALKPSRAMNNDEYRKYVDGLLLQVLYHSRLDQYEPADSQKIDLYMTGNVRHWSRGYALGHYIVSKAAERSGMSLLEAIEMPTGFYRDFVETKL